MRWDDNITTTGFSAQEKHIRKANLRKHRRKTLQQLAQSEDLFLTESIALANAERAASATSAPPISTALSMHQKIAVLPTIATAYSVHQLFPPTGSAYPVLDHETGQTLEHRQLKRLPKYKKLGTDRTEMSLEVFVKALVSIQPSPVNNV